MSKSNAEEFEVISVTFKLKNKIYSVALDNEQTPKPETALTGPVKGGKFLAAKAGAAVSTTQCINGQLHVRMCLGNNCQWVNTGITCGE